MAVAAEYVAKISADVTALDAGIAAARAKLAALGADVPATGIDSFVGRARTALAGVEAPISAISTSFASVGTAATAAFEKVSAAGASVAPVLTSISVSAEAAGAAIVSSSQLSANALNQVAASAEIAGTAIRSNSSGASAALDAVATSSTVAGQAAAKMGGEVAAVSTGLGTMAQGAVGAASSVADLALRKAELMTQLAGVSKELRSETSVMLGAQEAAKALGGNSQQLNQVYAESQAKVADLAVKQQLLKNELGNVAGALKTATAAQQATNVVQGVAATTTQEVGKQTGILSSLMTTHTSQISSQGTAWKGYDNVVQAVIRSMGGIPIVWALAITVGGVLLEKLLHLGDAKREQIRLDSEQIQLDTQLWQSMNTGTLFTKEYATVLHDVNAVSAEVKRSAEELLVARANEADAIRKSSTAYQDYAAGTDNLLEKVTAYTLGLFTQVEKETEATAARVEAAKALGTKIEMEIKAAAISGQTIGQLIAERTAAGATAAELSLLASAWGTAVSARSRYESGRSVLSTLKLELAQAAAERGEIIKKADALRVLTDAVSKLPEEQRKLAQQSQLTEKSLSALNSTTERHARSAAGAVPHIKAETQALDEQGKVLKGVTDAMSKIVESINKRAREIQIGQILHDKLVPIFEEAQKKAQEFRDGVVGLAGALDQVLGPATNKASESISKLKDVNIVGAQSFEALIVKTIEAKRAADAMQERMDRAAESLRNQFLELSRSIPDSWNIIIDAIGRSTKTTETEFEQFGVRVKGVFADVFQVIGNLPGKIGDALRKGASEFERWVATINGILGLLHRVFDSIPANLGDVISKVISIFKGVQKPVTDAAGAITGSLDSIQKAAKKASQEGASSAGTIVSSWSKASDGLKVGLSAAAGAFASLTTAMTVTATTGSKTAGIVSSLFTSTLAGIQAGLAFGPIGGAIVGGVSLIAGIFGSLFGGKSALQKAQEAAELQKAKDAIKISQQQVLQAVEQTKQSWIETLDKSRALLESIQFYAKVPKVSFEAFFKDVRKLFSKAIDLAKDFASAASADLKTAAENLKPVVELVAMLPTALDGINAHLKVPDIQFDKFFTDTETLIEKLAAAMQEIPRKVKRHARQFGDAIGDAFKVVPDIVTALVGLFDIKDVPEEKLNIFETVLRKLTDRIATIADNTDKYLLKAIAFFAEKMGGAVSLMTEVVSLIKEIVDLPMPSEESFDNLFKSLETGLNKAIETALKVTSESLPLAVAIWDKAKSIFEAVSSGVATVKAVAEAKWPDQAAWDGFVAAVKTAADAILAALDEATKAYDASVLFKDKAAATDANIAAAVASLSSAVAGASTIIGAAGAGLGSTTVVPASLASTFAPTSVVVPQSSLPAPSAPVVQQTVQQDISLSVTLQSVEDLIRLREIIDSLPRLFSRDGPPPLMSTT